MELTQLIVVVTTSSLLDIKKHLDSALGLRIWILGVPVWSQQLDSMIFVGSFQHASQLATTEQTGRNKISLLLLCNHVLSIDLVMVV